ncbi:MAG: hypothetical protein QNJ19_07640 [Woeseiaceae bacterium]|nr:hypothetical protein [Woeseiaceae bacterium]
MTSPLIIYIPGLLPKPEPAMHRDALYRSLMHGLTAHAPDVAERIDADHQAFDLVSWTYDFYGEHRDIALDQPSIDAMLEHAEAPDSAVDEASAFTRRLLRWFYLLGDFFPFLIPYLADERVEMHIRDLRRYAKDANGIAQHVREMLKLPLRAAAQSGRPTLLIAHSMGSVIAFDTLWQMSHEDNDHVRLDTLLTMGSPLGQRFIQRHLLGHGRVGHARYPSNIVNWKNLSARGDLTSVDPKLSNDFGQMRTLDLVETFDDEEILNWFRLDGTLNVHAEYGYLANPVTAKFVAAWWRSAVNVQTTKSVR